MSVSASFKEFLIEQMAGFGPVTIRAMFGGAGVMRDGLMFALIDDEVLYLKADDDNQERRLLLKTFPSSPTCLKAAR